LHKKIDESSMPQFQKDEAKAAVTASFQANQQQVDPAAQEAVNGAVGGDMQSMVDEMLMESVNEQLQDEAGAEESGSAGGKGGNGGGNWLVTLAKALGKMSGEHLDKMVELGNKMGAMGEESAGAMAEANAKFQAEAQMFRMLQESISTMLKSIGEGMSSVVRKQ